MLQQIQHISITLGGFKDILKNLQTFSYVNTRSTFFVRINFILFFPSSL